MQNKLLYKKKDYGLSMIQGDSLRLLFFGELALSVGRILFCGIGLRDINGNGTSDSYQYYSRAPAPPTQRGRKGLVNNVPSACPWPRGMHMTS